MLAGTRGFVTHSKWSWTDDLHDLLQTAFERPTSRHTDFVLTPWKYSTALQVYLARAATCDKAWLAKDCKDMMRKEGCLVGNLLVVC